MTSNDPIHPDAQSDLLNDARISEMIEDFGEDAFSEIVDAFLEDMEAALNELGSALTTGNSDEIGRVIHLVRGCASNLGIKSLVSLCDEVKSELTAGAMGDAAKLSSFQSTYDAAIEQLKRQYPAA